MFYEEKQIDGVMMCRNMIDGAWRPCKIEINTANKAEKKPPLGLVPEFIFEEDRQYDRLQQIFEAMARYCEEGKEIPKEWVTEGYRRLEQHRTMLMTKARL